MAVHPYAKVDVFRGELPPRERLEPARSAARWAIKMLEQFIETTERASDHLRDDQLEIICKAATQAMKAAENCALMGTHDSCGEYHAQPLEAVNWID